MTKILKISGLKVRPELLARYPKAGTLSARIVECLEAEPADVQEIADYIDSPEDKTRSLLCWLRDRRLIRHNGKFKYELIDPVGASLAYHQEKE